MTMGRPTKEFDWKYFDSVLKYNATKLDCAELLQVSEDTIERRIKKKHDMTFAAYRNKKMSHTRLTLVQKALSMAKGGNVAMMIFALKNLCGWSNEYEATATVSADSKKLVVNFSKVKEVDSADEKE